MRLEDLQIGVEVVRSKGDYVVGRVGKVVAINNENNRVQVAWEGNTKTWVAVDSMELTSVPYKIFPGKPFVPGQKRVWPRYVRL